MPRRGPSLHESPFEQERIEVTFRWMQQHVTSCPFLRTAQKGTGVACCLRTCALCSSVLVTDSVGNGAAWGFGVLLGILCFWRVLALLFSHIMSTGSGLRRCAYRWTRPLGRGRWEHYLRGLLGVHWFLQKCAWKIEGSCSYCVGVMLYVVAFVRLHSLHGYNACMVCWASGALRGHCRQNISETFFPQVCVFLFSRNSLKRFRAQVLLHLWVGSARKPGPSLKDVVVEVFNVGGWLTHGDLALVAKVDLP